MFCQKHVILQNYNFPIHILQHEMKFTHACSRNLPSSTILNAKINPAEIERRWAEALVLLRFALALVWFQIQQMNIFVLEHLTGASSWRLRETVALLRQPEVFLVTFHQCRFGLRAPISGLPIRKSTRLLTNTV